MTSGGALADEPPSFESTSSVSSEASTIPASEATTDAPETQSTSDTGETGSSTPPDAETIDTNNSAGAQASDTVTTGVQSIETGDPVQSTETTDTVQGSGTLPSNENEATEASGGHTGESPSTDTSETETTTETEATTEAGATAGTTTGTEAAGTTLETEATTEAGATAGTTTGTEAAGTTLEAETTTEAGATAGSTTGTEAATSEGTTSEATPGDITTLLEMISGGTVIEANAAEAPEIPETGVVPAEMLYNPDPATGPPMVYATITGVTEIPETSVVPAEMLFSPDPATGPPMVYATITGVTEIPTGTFGLDLAVASSPDPLLQPTKLDTAETPVDTRGPDLTVPTGVLGAISLDEVANAGTHALVAPPSDALTPFRNAVRDVIAAALTPIADGVGDVVTNALAPAAHAVADAVSVVLEPLNQAVAEAIHLLTQATRIVDLSFETSVGVTALIDLLKSALPPDLPQVARKMIKNALHAAAVAVRDIVASADMPAQIAQGVGLAVAAHCASVLNSSGGRGPHHLKDPAKGGRTPTRDPGNRMGHCRTQVLTVCDSSSGTFLQELLFVFPLTLRRAAPSATRSLKLVSDRLPRPLFFSLLEQPG